jgi:hypothetical protein
LKLFHLFQSMFLNKSKDQANLPTAQANFYQMKMTVKESAKEYIARVDTAVSDLAMLSEKVSLNSWLFILANGLRPEFTVTKKGVLFSEDGFKSIVEVKNKIMKEETVNNIGKPDEQNKNDSKDSEVAHAAFDGTCNHCGKKGHKKADCNKLKKETKAAATTKAATASKYWCDICYKERHSTEWCFYNPKNKGKGKGKAKGKAKGKGKGKGGNGKNGKGGRGKGNFPASYVSDVAQMASETWKSTEENWELKQNENWELKQNESSSSDWFDYSFFIFKNDFQEVNWEIEKSSSCDWTFHQFSVFETDILQDESTSPDFLFCERYEL